MSTVYRSLEGVCSNVMRQFRPRAHSIISRPRRIQLQRSFASRSIPHLAQATTSRPTPTTSGSSNSSSSSKPSTTTKSPTSATTSSSTSTTSPSSQQSPSPPPGKANEPQEEPDTTLIDWSKSFHGLSAEPFSDHAAEVLQAPLEAEDIEIKPDGILYLPEIKYRRILNKAFGPGAWGLAPRSEEIVTDKSVTREYALVVHGRLVSISRGEQDYFSKDNITTASEGCKSNAMMRCCKDLGIASELWDPRFIRKFKGEHTREVFVEHAVTKRKTKIWLRKGDPVSYPFKETRAQN